MSRYINGPNRLFIQLDETQAIPNDPGDGTPALVVKGSYTASYNCALNEGELGCGDYQLTPREMKWLESQESVVDEFLTKAYQR